MTGNREDRLKVARQQIRALNESRAQIVARELMDVLIELAVAPATQEERGLLRDELAILIEKEL